MTTSEDRAKALEATLADVNKRFGKGAAMLLGESTHAETETIPSGSLAIDLAIGLDGYPKGRIIEVYGPESSGKTLLTLNAIAGVQRKGGQAVFIDAEHAFDPKWARRIGVNTKDLILSQPTTGEEALEICDAFVRSGVVDIVVVDSVAALVPKKELEGDIGDQLPGLQARMMSQALRKITGGISQSKTSVFFINQLREKIGVMFGSPETTTGGKSLKFYASLRLDVRRSNSDAIKDKDNNIIGSLTKVKVVKNKLAAPYRIAEFDVFFGGSHVGYDRASDLRDLGVKYGVVLKSAASYSYNGNRFAVGKDKAREWLVENPEVADQIEANIRAVANESLDEDFEAAPEVAED